MDIWNTIYCLLKKTSTCLYLPTQRLSQWERANCYHTIQCFLQNSGWYCSLDRDSKLTEWQNEEKVLHLNLVYNHRAHEYAGEHGKGTLSMPTNLNIAANIVLTVPKLERSSSSSWLSDSTALEKKKSSWDNTNN